MRLLSQVSLFFGLFAQLHLAHAACGAYGNGQPPCETPFDVGKIEHVVIDTNWKATNVNRGEVDCYAWRQMTVEDVTNYLKKAGRITKHAYVKGDLSACDATGTLTTGKGRKARWFIGMDGEGGLEWTDSQHGVYLYCSRCGGLVDRKDRKP